MRPDEKGLTPLHKAVESGRPDCVERLLGAGADVRIRDEHGSTCLDLARTEVARGNDPPAILVLSILEGAEARLELARVESQFTLAATCALTCAGAIALGFAVIAVKILRCRRKRRGEA